MRIHPKYLLLPFFMVATILLTGCRTSRHVVSDNGSGQASAEAVDAVSRVNLNRARSQGIKAKVDLQAKAGNSKVSAGGNLRMQRDRLIQISVMFMGFVEAGRIELSPDYLFVMNRVNHEYCKTKWKDIKVLHDAGIDFYTFQALFWEELFMPGRHTVPQPADFDVIDLGTTQKLVPRGEVSNNSVMLNFIIGTVGGLIRQTHLQPVSQSNLTFDWNYTRWTAFEQGDFPEQMDIKVQAGTKTYELTLGLSHIETDERGADLELTEPSKRYKQVEIGSIVNRLLTNGR